MTNAIYLVGRGTVKEGRIEAATAALGAVIDKVRTNNPGVEFYEHAIDATGAWTGIERYADNEALRTHLIDPQVGEGLGRFMTNLSFEGLVVMGQVDESNQERMAPFAPTYLGTSKGFARAGARQKAAR